MAGRLTSPSVVRTAYMPSSLLRWRLDACGQLLGPARSRRLRAASQNRFAGPATMASSATSASKAAKVATEQDWPRWLGARSVAAVEVDHPDRRTLLCGKSETVDAEAASRAVLAGVAAAQPKSGTGPMEMVRTLRVARQTGSRKSHLVNR